MPNRLKQARFARLAVASAVLAFPLFASGVAQASIAGALPASSTTQPNLVRATTIPNVPNIIQVCYDKAITVGSGAGTAYTLVGYRAGNNTQKSGPAASGATVDPTNTSCVDVTFPGLDGTTAATSIDVTKYTVVTAAAGAVKANTGVSSSTSAADSVTVSPASTATASKDGTTGISTQPNLLGVLTPNGPQITQRSLTFVFDRNTLVKDATKFFFVNSAGNACQGTATLFVGNGTTNITVYGISSTTSPFPGASCTAGTTVDQAIRGGVLQGAVTSTQDSTTTGNYPQSVATSNVSGSARPQLLKAELNPSNFDQVTFTFDKSIVVQPGIGNQFSVGLSNGATLIGSGTPVLNGTNAVTVNFGGKLSPEAEYAVSAFANFGAVFTQDNPTVSGESIPASTNVGDNAGGLAPGFTTGPDVFGASVSGGTVTVTVDQRLKTAPGAFTLLTAQGQPIAGAATPSSVSFNASAGPGPATLTLTYPASVTTAATMIQFANSAMTTPLTDIVGAGDPNSVPQIVTLVRTSSILKGLATHHKKHHKHHKHHNKH